MAPITEDRVILIVRGIMDAYESKVGNVRHEANLKNFNRVFKVINQLKGIAIGFGLVITGFKVYNFIITRHF